MPSGVSGAGARYGLNDIVIGGIRYLLVGLSSSHLAALAEDETETRVALLSWSTEVSDTWESFYDMEALQAPIWNPRTVCGLEWTEMEAGDGPPARHGGHQAHAPDCRNCLRVVSRSLESVSPDERIPLVVALIVDEVLEYGETQVRGVPGEQVENLRQATRERFRRMKLRCQTVVIGSAVHVISEDVWNAFSDEARKAMMHTTVMSLDYLGEGTAPPRRGIDWETWDVTW